MLSIIICSVSPERLEQVTRNIHDTIGVDYEIIAIDNREKQWPIARAYNEGASRAHYPFLFFVHEDVKFTQTLQCLRRQPDLQFFIRFQTNDCCCKISCAISNQTLFIVT